VIGTKGLDPCVRERRVDQQISGFKGRFALSNLKSLGHDSSGKCLRVGQNEEHINNPARMPG
jgi:hypothetical protein